MTDNDYSKIKFEVPHAVFKELRLPIGALRSQNLIREVPVDVKILIADVLMLWGKTGTKLAWLANQIHYKQKGINIALADRKGRYRIIRDISKEHERLGEEVHALLWRLFTSNKHQISTVRNTLAHGDIVGMLYQPEGCIAIITVKPDGGFFHVGMPQETVEIVRNNLDVFSQALDRITQLYIQAEFEPSLN